MTGSAQDWNLLWHFLTPAVRVFEINFDARRQWFGSRLRALSAFGGFAQQAGPDLITVWGACRRLARQLLRSMPLAAQALGKANPRVWRPKARLPVLPPRKHLGSHCCRVYLFGCARAAAS